MKIQHLNEYVIGFIDPQILELEQYAKEEAIRRGGKIDNVHLNCEFFEGKLVIYKKGVIDYEWHTPNNQQPYCMVLGYANTISLDRDCNVITKSIRRYTEKDAGRVSDYISKLLKINKEAVNVL